MTQDNSTVRQIELFHSEWSKMDLGSKMGFLMGKQIEINSWANALARNRAFRGYFTQDEMAAVQQLQDVQNELDRHKGEGREQLVSNNKVDLRRDKPSWIYQAAMPSAITVGLAPYYR